MYSRQDERADLEEMRTALLRELRDGEGRAVQVASAELRQVVRQLAGVLCREATSVSVRQEV